MENISLIGFMGTGKSSVGKLLASRLGFSFTDLDAEIEAKCNMTIPEIFDQYGEDYFREKEKETLKELVARKNAVIATGGGAVKDAENLSLLKKSGFVIALTASAEVIYERTARIGERPLLDNATETERKQRIVDMLEERKKFYEQADYAIDTDELSPMQVADDIAKFVKVRRS